MDHLTLLDKDTGKGKAGQELDPGGPGRGGGVRPRAAYLPASKGGHRAGRGGRSSTPRRPGGVVMGGHEHGAGPCDPEEFVQAPAALGGATSFRTYKMLRIGEEPEYLVDFVETPQVDAPFGARGIAEHGSIGMPAAWPTRRGQAAGVDIEELPVTPELIWRKKGRP